MHPTGCGLVRAFLALNLIRFLHGCGASGLIKSKIKNLNCEGHARERQRMEPSRAWPAPTGEGLLENMLLARRRGVLVLLWAWHFLAGGGA